MIKSLNNRKYWNWKDKNMIESYVVIEQNMHNVYH